MTFTRIVLLTASVLWSAEQPPFYPGKPYGPANKLISPDGSYALYGDARLPQVWLVDEGSHKWRLAYKALLTLNTITLAWSPDSKAFVVNDRESSDFEASYLVEADDLARTDIRERILSTDPSARTIDKGASHSYVETIRWLDNHNVEARLFGHSDGGQREATGLCFDLRFQVGRDGEVKKLSQRAFPLGSAACAGMG